MCLLCSSPPFISTCTNYRSPFLPLPAIPTQPQLSGGRRRRMINLSASSKLRCSSAMVIDEGYTSSSSYLQEEMSYSRAFWVSKETIAWNVDAGNGSYFLFGSKNATLALVNGEIQGYDVKIELEESNETLPKHVIERFPHIQDFKPLQVHRDLDVKSLLKYQLTVANLGSGGECTSITGLQLPGILDELFYYSGPLDAVFSSEAVSLYLWAPHCTESKCAYLRRR